MTVAEALARLRGDHTSGSTALLALALEALEAFTFPADWHAALTALVTELVAAQPSMAVLLNLAQAVLEACPPELPAASARQRLRQTVQAWRQRLQESTARLCRQALAVLPPQATVLTYSNSATVVAALCHAHDQGRLRRVLVGESRPACEGQALALALHAHGIAVDYGTDMALLHWLPRASVVWVGADAVLPHALINKLGTAALARLARHHGVPVFSLCTADKFLPAAAADLLRLPAHAPAEVWPAALAGITVHNPYFEAVPLELLSGVLCEEGLLPPAVLCHTLQQRRLAPALAPLASRGAGRPPPG